MDFSLRLNGYVFGQGGLKKGYAKFLALYGQARFGGAVKNYFSFLNAQKGLVVYELLYIMPRSFHISKR